ncbi:MAG: GntR family transcriptional regulator [Edaphobacter sp.]|uniref:GntR family transcriptional regulator n=1 Tax=Edaphobacter sp. TaxID=1934404 RepID=UPI00238CB23B|nr:GntR family transcriptional regulator [Edaphobacter sp.]MDE1176383.1 GntR family transcriptional regulator [Edaphobacter sp.]
MPESPTLREEPIRARGLLKSIPRTSMKSLAVQQIREAIEHGELLAGEKVTELGLAKKLGVGQPTIREALLELEFLGFIERKGPRDTRVTLLTRSTIRDIYRVRVRLETLAVELIAFMDKPDLSTCWNEALRMENAARDGRAADFYQADLGFHRELWAVTQNESLQSCLEQLVPRLMTFSIIQRVQPSSDKLLEIAILHRRLLETISSHNIASSVALMEESMKNALMDDEHMPGLEGE